MIVIVKTFGSQKGSPAAAEEEADRRGGGRGEGGEKRRASEVNIGVDGAKREIKVERKYDPE